MPPCLPPVLGCDTHASLIEHFIPLRSRREFITLPFDIGLPDIDGYELARRLCNEPAVRDTLFVGLTGYGQTHDRVLSKSAGFDHHFVKPVDSKNCVNC